MKVKWCTEACDLSECKKQTRLHSTHVISDTSAILQQHEGDHHFKLELTWDTKEVQFMLHDVNFQLLMWFCCHLIVNVPGMLSLTASWLVPVSCDHPERVLITWLNPWCYVLMLSLGPCDVSTKYCLILFNMLLCPTSDILFINLDKIRAVVNSKWCFNNVSSPLPFFESATYQCCLSCKIPPMRFALFWMIAFSSITVKFTWKVIFRLMFKSGNNGILSWLINCNAFEPSCSGDLVILLTPTLKLKQKSELIFNTSLENKALSLLICLYKISEKKATTDNHHSLHSCLLWSAVG